MCVCSEVISETVLMRNAVQTSWILDVNFSSSLCLWRDCLNYHLGNVCEIKVGKGSRLA